MVEVMCQTASGLPFPQQFLFKLIQLLIRDQLYSNGFIFVFLLLSFRFLKIFIGNVDLLLELQNILLPLG